ncbi:MAG: Endo-1,4-beta-xylanase A precursor [Pelotomaculum sp. PtaB.Bin013]|nr:MAG: Endo-1,4-beta-xylanase A precursor [Pelotomaculum sp. PtaB.Bin013]
MCFKNSVLSRLIAIIFIVVLVIGLSPKLASADPVITEGDTWVSFQDETDHFSYTVTVQSAFTTPSAGNPATLTIEATSKDGNETVCAFKAGTLTGDLFDAGSGASFGTPGIPAATLSASVTSADWCYIGCKSTDSSGNPVTASMSFQLPMEGGGESTAISLAGTTVTSTVYGKNAVADWTLNLKPSKAIAVKAGDKLTLQAAGAMFHAVSGVTCVTDTVTGLELSSKCIYTADGKPDSLEISFCNTVPVTILATGIALRISNVVNPTSEQSAACTTTPVVKLATVENAGQVNAPSLSFTDSALSLVLSKTSVSIDPNGQLLDGPLTATVSLTDGAGNLLNLDKQVKIRVKNAPATSLNGIGGSGAYDYLVLTGGTGTYEIKKIKDSDVREGSFTRTIEVRLADNPYMTAESNVTVTYHNNCKITGKLIDQDTGQPVSAARIDIRDSQGQIYPSLYSAADGKYEAVVTTGGSGNLTINKEDYVDDCEYYYPTDLSSDTYDMGDIRLEHYEFKANITYGYSTATRTGPGSPVTPDNYYGPYNSPYFKKGNTEFYPDKVSGSTCYFKKGRGISRGDTVDVVLQLINNLTVKKTLPLTISADYDAENKVEFVEIEKGFAVIIADENPPAGQTGNVVGRILGANWEDVKFELAPGQAFIYGKNPWELENGNYDLVVMNKDISAFLPRSLNYLTDLDLVEGVDYNKYSITVADGTISALTVSAPISQKRTVLDSDGTTIYAKPAYNSPLTPFVVKYKLKSGYEVNTSRIIVELPDGVDFTDDCGVYNTQERSYEIGCQYDAAGKRLSIETYHTQWITNLNSFVFTVKAGANASGKLTASLKYQVAGSRIESEEMIGSAEIAAPQISLYGPSTTSTADVLMRGAALPGAEVTIYDGETSLGNVNTNKAGSFEKQVNLDNAEPGSTHYLTAKTGTGAEEKISSVVEVVYQPLLPNITKLLYQTPGFGPVELIGTNRPARIVAGWGDNMSFTVETSDDLKINKMWVVIANGDAYNSGGQPMIVPAFFDMGKKQWLTGPFNGRLNEFNPGPVSVQFTLNNYVPGPIEMLPLPADYFNDPYKYFGTTQEEYLNSLPPELKNAKVNITRSGGSGITADITLADQAQSQFTYAVDVSSPPVTDKPGGVTEEKLTQKGFHKVPSEDGGSVYIKQTVNGEEINEFIANDRISSLPSDSVLNVATTLCIFKNQSARGNTGNMTPASDGGAYFDMSTGTPLYYPPPNGQHYSYTGQSAGAWGETLYYQAPAKQSDGSYNMRFYKFNGMKNGWEPVAPEDMPADFAEHNAAIPDSEMTGMGANWPSVNRSQSGGQSDDHANTMTAITTEAGITTGFVSNFNQVSWYGGGNLLNNITKIEIASMTINELNDYMKLQIDTLWAMRLRTNSSGTVCYDLLSDEDKQSFDRLLQNMKDRRAELQDFTGQYAAYNILTTAGGAVIPGWASVGIIPGGQVLAVSAIAGAALTQGMYNCAVGNQQLDNFRQSAQQFANFNNAWARKFYLMCGNVHSTPAQTNPAFVIDPSGCAYEGTLSNPVAGVQAELWLADDSSGTNARLWAEAPDYNQINPQTTSADGWYHWDVPAGWWQVRLSKAGYNSTRSEWLPVPPPQLGINLEMIKPGGGNGGGSSSNPSASPAVTVIADATGKAKVTAAQLATAETIVVKGAATVSLNKEAVAAIKAAGMGDATFSITKAGIAELPIEAKTIIGDRTVYEFTVTIGGKTVTDFGAGTATVAIPYIPKPDEDTSAIVICCIDTQSKLIMVSCSAYDPATKTAIFKTGHFSKYAIGYNKVEFGDVSGWATSYITYLSARGIINGVGNNKYAPDDNITRADFTKILAGVAGADSTKYTASSFNDVKATDYYAGSVQWSAEKGIVFGVGSGKFDPQAYITRQDMAVMIARFAKVMKYALPKTVALSDFADQTAISAHAVEAAQEMQQAKIIEGKVCPGEAGCFFAPEDQATRAEAAKMLTVLMQGMLKQ